MVGVRVSELAKELGMTSKDLLQALNDLGVTAAGPAALIEAETGQLLREMFAPQAGSGKVVEISPAATVKDIADAIEVPAAEVQKKLMAMGVLASINQRLSPEVAAQLAAAYGATLRLKAEAVVPSAAAAPRHRGPSTGPQPRPPVVTVLGHVDHGKTTLLDAIRHTNVVEGEFGGITQHIGAYQVEVEYEGEKRRITFLDTPGHAAFTKMRARGASVTDIAVLVVAADDGIMPQTIEAIDHARAAEVPIIVAVNKIDKPDANPERVKTQLTEHNLVPREYGGDVECVPVSAKTGQGIDELLEHILFQADLMELRADPQARVRGVIIEARQETGRGPVATVLVQEGTLRVGDIVVCGLARGKIRAMTNEHGERVYKASPATPVEIIGLSTVPQAGDILEEVKDERTAREITEQRAQRARQQRLAVTERITLDDIYRRIQEGEARELNLVVKADVQGSVEAVVGQLQQLPQDEVSIRIIRSGVGPITEDDIMLASASGAVVIGFNVRVDSQAQQVAEREHVEIRTFQIIYELTDAVTRAMKGLLAPVYEEVPLGKAECRRVFRTSKGVLIAGSYVTEGKVVRNANVRVVRGRDVVHTGKVDSLKHLKDDVREMAQGFECGIVIDGLTDLAEGDVLEVYEMRQVER
jgi:translation initiation factor IF-2